MTLPIINEFRKKRGFHAIGDLDMQESENCTLHCRHMAQIGDVEHAPLHYRYNKAEAVGASSTHHNIEDTAWHLIHHVLGESIEHASVMLYPNLGCGIFVDNHTVYITIRGWL